MSPLTRAKGKLIVIGHHGALATLQHGPQPILWECIEEANANGLHLDATTILQAMTFSLHDSPIESDAVLPRCWHVPPPRETAQAPPSRLTSLVQASPANTLAQRPPHFLRRQHDNCRCS